MSTHCGPSCLTAYLSAPTAVPPTTLPTYQHLLLSLLPHCLPISTHCCPSYLTAYLSAPTAVPTIIHTCCIVNNLPYYHNSNYYSSRHPPHCHNYNCHNSRYLPYYHNYDYYNSRYLT